MSLRTSRLVLASALGLALSACGLLTQSDDVAGGGGGEGGPVHPEPTGDLAADAVAALNYHRAWAGLPEVTEDPALSAGCAAHAGYMRATGSLTHAEDPSNAAYTDAGDAAGRASNVAQGQFDMVGAVDLWMTGVYHRLPMMQPGLRRIGVGLDGGWTCLNVLSGRDTVDDFDAVLVPSPDQTGVPSAFGGNEFPDPLDGTGLAAPTGYLISALFPADAAIDVANTSATLWANGIPQPAFVRMPGDPDDPNSAALGNAILIVPQSAFAVGSTYRVTLRGAVGADLFSYDWEFSTAP